MDGKKREHNLLKKCVKSILLRLFNYEIFTVVTYSTDPKAKAEKLTEKKKDI